MPPLGALLPPKWESSVRFRSLGTGPAAPATRPPPTRCARGRPRGSPRAPSPPGRDRPTGRPRQHFRPTESDPRRGGGRLVTKQSVRDVQMRMGEFRRNHYVPRLVPGAVHPEDAPERKFHYLDLRPESVVRKDGRTYKRADLLRWGPKRCFVEEDLYTTRFGAWESTEIEQYFFGEVDSRGRRAVDYFAGFAHPHMGQRTPSKTCSGTWAWQKLRNAQGVARSGRPRPARRPQHGADGDAGAAAVHGALWSESVWSLATSPRTRRRSSSSRTIPSPCTTRAASPRHPSAAVTATPRSRSLARTRCSRCPWTGSSSSRTCRGCGTRTPTPRRSGPNPNPFRGTFFNWLQIQTLRELDEQEVLAINHIIKTRAHRYVAAAERDWLYPERHLTERRWDRLAGGPLPADAGPPRRDLQRPGGVRLRERPAADLRRVRQGSPGRSPRAAKGGAGATPSGARSTPSRASSPGCVDRGAVAAPSRTWGWTRRRTRPTTTSTTWAWRRSTRAAPARARSAPGQARWEEGQEAEEGAALVATESGFLACHQGDIRTRSSTRPPETPPPDAVFPSRYQIGGIHRLLILYTGDPDIAGPVIASTK